MGDFDPAFDLPDYYGEEDFYEDKYADELDMLDDFEEDGPPVKQKKANHQSNAKKLQFSNPAVHEDSVKPPSPEKPSKDPIKEVDKQNSHSPVDFSLKLSQSQFEDYSEYQESNIVNTSGPDPKKQKIEEESESIVPNEPIIHRKWVVKQPRHSWCSRSRRVHTRPPLGKDIITITNTDGDRVFLVMKPSAEEVNEEYIPDFRSLQLLSTSFEDLKREVEEKKHKQAIEKVEALSKLLTENESAPEDSELDENTTENEEQEHTLWVEKYTPRRFPDLLSDDGTNRTLLKWLKLWDGLVFGKDYRIKKTVKEKQLNGKENNKFGKRKKPWEIEEELELDMKGRPVHKIALLSGNPGLGKTTLAHVIAKHAGYNIVEMNASDDRSPDIFRDKLETATQMKACMGDGKKPNCLIIDEIDGAPAQAINVLIQAAKETDSELKTLGPDWRSSIYRNKCLQGRLCWELALEHYNYERADCPTSPEHWHMGLEPEPSKKKKKKSQLALTRPVICICNDQFVPSLRQLRQIALAFAFPATNAGRLAQRLLDISRKEKMRVDMATVLTLCDKSENDIRSCINTLQKLIFKWKLEQGPLAKFIHKKFGELKSEHIRNIEVGQKDFHKGLFHVWHEIFQLPKAKKIIGQRWLQQTNKDGPIKDNLAMLNVENSSNLQTSTSMRFYNILFLAMSNSEYEKMIQGLFDNYLNAKTKDPHLESVVSANEWLVFSDIINTRILESQTFVLMKFLPFLPVAFHLMFAGPTTLKLNYSNSMMEHNTRISRSKQIVEALTNEVTPNMRRNLSLVVAVLDIFPSMFEIIQPNMRPVNVQLYSESEKQQLLNLISTMISYSLTYHQEKNQDGQYSYILDPNIEEVIAFPGLPQHKHLTYNSKQMIQREIELEKMRRSEQAVKTSEKKSSGQMSKEKDSGVKVVHKLEPLKVRKQAYKPTKDFFGRVVQPKVIEERTTAKEKKPSIINTQVWFKFNEGYTNAVRRPIKVLDFL